MHNLASIASKNRLYKTALSLEDFGDKTEFKSYTNKVASLGDALLAWAQNDRNGISITDDDNAIPETVWNAVKVVLGLFSDDDLKVKADPKSVRALRDTAIKFRPVTSDEYKAANKKKKSFEGG